MNDFIQRTVSQSFSSFSSHNVVYNVHVNLPFQNTSWMHFMLSEFLNSWIKYIFWKLFNCSNNSSIPGPPFICIVTCMFCYRTFTTVLSMLFQKGDSSTDTFCLPKLLLKDHLIWYHYAFLLCMCLAELPYNCSHRKISDRSCYICLVSKTGLAGSFYGCLL